MEYSSAMCGDLRLDSKLEARLISFLGALINQNDARVIVPAYQKGPGFWFGGGDLVGDDTGTLWLVGRYRNAGDSRTGTAAGTRGLELALFKSTDRGGSFVKAACWSKQDLSYPELSVVSIEGSSLLLRNGRVELYVSTEKAAPYPDSVATFQKPGTGIWSIDRFTGDSPESLDVTTLAPALTESPEPGYLHVKDPVVYDDANGNTTLIFCDHPFSWTSMNSGYATRAAGEEAFTLRSWQMVDRGPAWDVAGARITSRLVVPAIGAFADAPAMAVYFYDGMECYREHEQNRAGVHRPRGFSCEELGGALYGPLDVYPRMGRLSQLFPLFVSPYGTGCSRYIETLATEDGIHAIWQQSQPDGSQPLVHHFLSCPQIESLLG